MPIQPPPVVVVGASAGGVEALMRLVECLPADLPAAVFVVLHVPPDASSRLESILDRVSPLPASTAQDGEPIEPGRIYVAVPDRHLMVERGRVRLTYGPREGRVRPSIDVLFRSAAAAFGPRVVGVVLSGTLDDGTSGLWNIKDRGGRALVQEPGTALFSCMPESAIRNVVVDAVLPLEDLGAEIASMVEALPRDPDHSDAPERLRIENLIALEGNGLRAGIMNLGPISASTCPECHGVLVQIEEGPITRFRCHTGHSYSLRALLDAVDRAVHDALWDTVRLLEERILLLRQMAKSGMADPAEPDYAEQADETARTLQPLRALALDPRLLGAGAGERVH